jgi:hypothetical protein
MQIDFSKVQSAEARAKAVLVAARLGAEARLATLIEAALTELTGPLPLAERLSWPIKEAAARAVLDDSASPAEIALLEAEAFETGESVAALAARIVARAAAWNRAVADLSGLRRRIAAAIAHAPDPQAVAKALAEAEVLQLDPLA